MPTLVSLVFPERGNLTLKGQVSDEHAIFFASYLFNEEEREIYKSGRFREAAERLLKRRQLALQSMDEETLAELILNRFFVEYSSNEIERINIITRLSEVFDFPHSMVFDRRTSSDQPHQYKISIDRAEIAQIVLGIIQTLSASASDSSIQTQETNAPAQEPVTIDAIEQKKTETQKTETQIQIELLTQQIEKLQRQDKLMI